MRYTTQHIQAMFNVSHQTVKNWCTEFAIYLSPSATPPSGRQRQFTIDDLRVMSLAAEMRNRGALNDEIRAALQNGQRGELTNEMSTALVPTATLITGVAELQETVKTLTLEINKERQQRIRAEGQVELLEKQLSAAQQEIRQLIRENARLDNHD